MEQLLLQLRVALTGTISTSPTARSAVRRDGSLFEIIPDAVALPESSADVQQLVRTVTHYKRTFPKLALTPRGAGTDMSGAAIGSSIILDTSKFKQVTDFKGRLVKAQPGALLADIETMLAAHSLALGASPSSRDVATIGGSVANNASGEHAYRYGTMQRWVRALKVVLADGNEYTVKPLNKKELERKMAEQTYEGRLYAHLYSLVNRNYDTIRNARPYTRKNTTGYNLWDVWDKEAGVFDLTQLLTGSQGTLGVITEVTLEAVPRPQYTETVLIHVRSLRKFAPLLEQIEQMKPLSIEGFDDITFLQGLHSYSTLRRQIGNREYLKQQLQLLAKPTRRGAPNFTLTVEFDGATKDAVLRQVVKCIELLAAHRVHGEHISGDGAHPAHRRLRSTTLSLIQEQVRSRHAASFIDDMAVHPRHTTAFLPKLRALLRKHKIPATIHGHFGDGTFHVLPLQQIRTEKEYARLEAAMRDLALLVAEYDGSLAGEHGDGMVRGPWLPAQYSKEVTGLFRAVKELFDPLYIFNPHKKTDATWEYSLSHLRPAAPNKKKR